MKTRSKIAIEITAYIFLLIGSYFLINNIVNKKQRRLRNEAYVAYDKYFSKQDMFVSIAYSDQKVTTEEIDIPKYITFSNYKDYILSEDKNIYFKNTAEQKEKYEEYFGDLYKMYKIVQSGWKFNIIKKVSYGVFQLYEFFPYAVGYKRNSYLYYSPPSPKSAVDEAFKYYSSNEGSIYSKNFSNITINDIKYDIQNEYYELYSYDYDVKWLGEKNAKELLRSHLKNGKIFEYYTNESNPTDDFNGGYMYNNSYKVFNNYENLYYFQIVYRDKEDPMKKDLIQYCSYAAILLTIPFICFLTQTIIVGKRKKKIKNESLKEKLLRMCNPSNFMSPYDEKKVSKSNDIYERLMNIHEEDIDALRIIRKDATSSLGLNFVDEEILKQLIDKANPKRYMKPYDAEKVRIANQIYTRLIAGVQDADEVEQIQDEIEKKLTK